MLYEVKKILYTFFTNFKNVVKSQNDVIYSYIMEIFLECNSFRAKISKTKHGIKLHQNNDIMLPKFNLFCVTGYFSFEFKIYNNSKIRYVKI